jgi:hypothetical protein
MTEPEATTTTNTAEAGATVGIQAEYVHNSTVYQVLPDASPRQKYEVGVRFLEDGVPIRARDLIGDAIAHGYDDGEVRFHWMLAMLSKRSLRDLTAAEHAQLERISQLVHDYADDGWKHALVAVCELLNRLKHVDRDCAAALERLRGLPPRQRDKIVRHLDLVLTGGLKNTLWAETRQAAEDSRLGNDRLDRVWAYFHPDPIGPRVRPPAGESTAPGDRARALGWSALAMIAFGYLCQVALAQGELGSVLACVLVVTAGYIALRNGLEWRYRSARLTAKELDYFGQQGVHRAPEAGFANRVDHSFAYYFAKYVPKGVDRERWLAGTVGIRTTLRDEVVELYRESRVGVDRVNWLIRHLVSDVRTRWEAGTLLRHRARYRTDLATKVWCWLALVTLVLASLEVVVTVVQANPFAAAAAVIVALVSARAATLRCFHIISEGRRFREDDQESKRQMAVRQAAYERWRDKLDATRPSEGEMETWLRCDKTMLLDAALRHYGLVWREVITHAFLQAPAKNYKRARVKGGPWRYSKYDIRLFLITQDGVREVSTELDFEHVALKGQERNNYRFDAVSSVQVVEAGASSCTLELTLFNGPSRNIRVVDPEVRQADDGESPATLSETNLDSAGFAHTLHILEGIAAEGKSWIDRDARGKADPGRPPDSGGASAGVPR